MELLPLALSADVWTPFGILGGRQAPSLPSTACRYCGFHASGWMAEPATGGSSISSCINCHLCRHLERETIDDEATLIWLPEMTQAALIAVSRCLHLICARHGAAPTMDHVPRSRAAQLLQAWGLHEALLRRAAAAERRLGSSSLRELGEALIGVSAADPRKQSSMLGGLRLLPSGRFFRDGRDVYPSLLTAYLEGHSS